MIDSVAILVSIYYFSVAFCRLRLRKKVALSPTAVYSNDMKFDYDEISLHQDMELIVEVLDGMCMTS
jgi:hypothetical protein